MVKHLLIGSGVAILALAGVVAAQEPTFRVERSTHIAAPAAKAFALVNDFRAWGAWSPYEKLDPQMQRTFKGSHAGTGAVYEWTGSKAGEGRMTIETSRAPSEIAIRLEFIKPLAATNRASFHFDPDHDGTKVTWTMEGRKNLVAKALHLFMDVDKLVGSDFEKGLLAMKTAAESPSPENTQAKAP